MYGFDLMAIPFLFAVQSPHHYLAAMTHAQVVQGPMLPDLLLPSSLFLIRPIICPFYIKIVVCSLYLVLSGRKVMAVFNHSRLSNKTLLQMTWL